MKVFYRDFNGILGPLQNKLEITENPHEADVFLLWQDVRGSMKELTILATQYLHKPVIVVQHGRGATRDYCSPNKFPLFATVICVWGEADKQRLLKQGIEEHRIRIVGCPLFAQLQPRIPVKNRNNVLFVPIITDKEEPENHIIFQILREIECKETLKFLYKSFDSLKKVWKQKIIHNTPDQQRVLREEIVSRIGHDVLTQNFRLFVKLTPIHDRDNYFTDALITEQGKSESIALICDTLKNTDLVICLEDGTLPLLAHALNIPVVLVDIFKWNNYGGTDYSKVEIIRSPACYRVTKYDNIEKAIRYALGNGNEKVPDRIKTCEDEGGIHLGNPLNNILNVIKEVYDKRIVYAKT